MDVIKKLRKEADIQDELKNFFKNLALQVEEYMCQLLDQVKVLRIVLTYFYAWLCKMQKIILKLRNYGLSVKLIFY